jgi:hypothetical protein
VSSTLLNKPYDAFADEGADEEVVVETKSRKQQQCQYTSLSLPCPARVVVVHRLRGWVDEEARSVHG